MLSSAVLLSAGLSIFPAASLFPKYIMSFTSIAKTRIPATTGLKLISPGLNIFPKEVLISSTPISTIRSATISPTTYSTRPCPKGCSSSASCPESLKPTRVTMDEPTSDRLFKASAIIEMEPVIKPAAILETKRIILRKIPTAPLSTPYCCLTLASFTDV